MERTKQFNRREFIKILENNGYSFVSCKGDHGKWRKGERIIVIPLGGHSINKMICRRLIKENRLKL